MGLENLIVFFRLQGLGSELSVCEPLRPTLATCLAVLFRTLFQYHQPTHYKDIGVPVRIPHVGSSTPSS